MFGIHAQTTPETGSPSLTPSPSNIPALIEKDERPGYRSKLLFSALLALWAGLQVLIYPPGEWWWVSYFCLVPWAVAICAYQGRKWLYSISYLWSVLFLFLCLHWLWNVAYIPIGKPGPEQIRIPAGSAAIAVYFGAFFPPMAWAIRHLYWTRRLSLTLVLPTVWVAGEYVRGSLLIEFPWFTLAQSHYRQLTLIQISDLIGAYGVSFIIAMVNGFFADAVMLRWFRLPARARPGFKPSLVVALLVFAASTTYGRIRLARDTMSAGPTVALIQSNHVLEVMPEGESTPPWGKKRTHMALIEDAALSNPDLFVLPESPWFMFLNPDYRQLEATPRPPAQKWSRQCHEDFLAIVRDTGAFLVTGAMSREFYPTVTYPTEARFNSAFIYAPGQPEPSRYDKIHLVLFGEYVPFRGGSLHFLYEWLNSITPWGQGGYEYSLTPGREFNVFDMSPRSQPAKTFSFGVPICYEDVMPYVARNFVIGPDGKKRVDFLINISNDGWFHRGTELIQHLSLAVFRCVENRVGMARAVNTGISAFIKPTGEIYAPVQKEGRRRGPDVEGFSVATLMTDSRLTLYSRFGDWFAASATMLIGFACLDALWVRRRRFRFLRKTRPAANRTG